ncbi:MAG: hypothetical protein IPM59_01170 [Chloracidobacterium sp.]|nr:hypothetical protein [Chloracidobacterium sp.]
MFRKIVLSLSITIAPITCVLSQTPSPTPLSPDAQMAALQQQIDLLKKQQEFEKAKSELANQRLKEVMEALPKVTGLKVPESKTTFTDDPKPSAETVSLSYEALKALSVQIEPIIRPITSQYAGIVIHNETDFTALAKYRVYRSQSDTALKNFEAWRKKVEDEAQRQANAGDIKIEAFDPITAGLSIPTIATAFAGSVGELLSLFRTETAITESVDTVDDEALGAAIASELKKGNSRLRVLYPKAFVPEYDLESEGRESILLRVSEINQALVEVTRFLAWANKLTSAQQEMIAALIEGGRTVKAQLQSLAVANEKVGGQDEHSADGDDDRPQPQQQYSDLRQLVRAEKLDRFLRQGADSRIGIVKLRSLASGGSRRETRNLFLGNKIRYSGSVTIEFLLFDIDGMLQASEIFSLHTGFRKLVKD